MTWNLWLLVAAALAITFANGANDNFKSVATLFGSATATYRRALLWGTVTTAAGSLTALVLGGSLLARFSGKGLVPDALTADPAFLTAVGAGAAATVFFATWLGFPVSTTHALTGALVGAGLLAAGGELRLSALGTGFIAPLLLSPLAAAVLVGVTYISQGWVRRRWAIEEDICMCVVETPPPLNATSPAYASLVPDGQTAALRVPVVAAVSECAARGVTPTVTALNALDAAHYLSAGAVAFARGVNDTPKLLALLLPAQILPTAPALALLAVVMALGGLLGSSRVAETMSHRVTTMTPGQGFLANVTTAVLVLFASRIGVAVSTTHISSGSLFGLGAITGHAQWRTIVHIVLAWVVTLPCAAACGALAYSILSYA
jgi:inorganic phosphate transporter, PiT family